MRILYVEDDPMDADLTRRMLAKKAPHLQIDIARSQKEALEILGKIETYDLLLSDLRLPDGSGYNLLTYVREHALPLAVVMITGQGDEEIAVSVLKSGADDYVVKRQDYLDRLAPALENAYQRYLTKTANVQHRLRVLYLENDPSDIEMTRKHFAHHAAHIHLEFVHSSSDVYKRLSEGDLTLNYDILMLEYRWQDYEALDLLKTLHQTKDFDLPVILITDHGDEEVAAQTLHLGADDYVVKNPGYLYRLPGLLENAYYRVQLQREQKALRASEERFRRMAENAPDIIYRLRVQPSISLDYVNPALATITGYTLEDIQKDLLQAVKMINPEDRALLKDLLEGKLHRNTPIVFRLINKDGDLIWLEARNTPVADNAGNVIAHEGIARDITERIRAETHIQRQLQRLNALRMVDAAITANLNLKGTLNVLLEHVTAQLGVHAAAIFLYDESTQLLNFSAGTGFHTKKIEDVQARLGEGNTGLVALQQHTIYVSDRTVQETSLNFPEALESEGFVSYLGTPLIAKGQIKGVLEVYHRLPLNPDSEWLSFFETLARQAAIAIDNAKLFENLQKANLELSLAYDHTLEGWVRALDLRDKETQGHTRRVTELTLRLAREMSIPDSQMVHIRYGALLHDIGKMAISDSILLKPGPLTDEEWEIMRKHPLYAYELLYPIEFLRPALDIPYCHHERWDGSGYPNQLKGEQIPMPARLFAVADVWDALNSDRPYRPRWQPEKALEHILSQSGHHFDPLVVEKFQKLISVLPKPL